MMEIERPKIEMANLSPDGRYGKFVVEPLERGFGTTLGNSLRRVLLSSPLRQGISHRKRYCSKERRKRTRAGVFHVVKDKGEYDAPFTA